MGRLISLGRIALVLTNKQVETAIVSNVIDDSTVDVHVFHKNGHVGFRQGLNSTENLTREDQWMWPDLVRLSSEVSSGAIENSGENEPKSEDSGSEESSNGDESLSGNEGQENILA